MTLNQIKVLADGLAAIENVKTFSRDEKPAVEFAKKVIQKEIKLMKKEYLKQSKALLAAISPKREKKDEDKSKKAK